jgi:hypothetical protein
MMSRAERARAGFLVLDQLVGPDHDDARDEWDGALLRGERMPTRRHPRLAEGTAVDLARPDAGGAAARDPDARRLRIRMVELLASEPDPAARAAAARQIASLGDPLPAGVLRALACLAQDPEPRVRAATATTLVRLIEALEPFQRSALVVRLAASSRPELRLLVAFALRFGPLVVGGLSALEHLVDDPDEAVRRAALISVRYRLREAPVRLAPVVRRKLVLGDR